MKGELVKLDFMQTVSDMREELDDHLTAINENTEEIETNYSYLMDLNKRMKFLESKMEQIFNLVSKFDNAGELKQKTAKIHISKAEQDVFLVFYQNEQALSMDDIALKLVKSPSYVRSCINMLIEKCVPLVKHMICKKIYYTLDPAFKELQTKKGIVAIERDLTLECFDQSIVQVGSSIVDSNKIEITKIC